MPPLRSPRGRPSALPYQGNKIAQVATPRESVPVPSQNRQTYKTDLFTYLTIVGKSPNPLYNGDQEWAAITLTLETAGPVAVSTRADLLPVLSGKGMLLTTNEPVTITCPRATKIYIASTSTNRVKVKIEPYPWQEQQLGAMVQGNQTLHAIMSPIAQGLASLLQRFRGG